MTHAHKLQLMEKAQSPRNAIPCELDALTFRALLQRGRSDFILALLALFFFLHPLLRMSAFEDSFLSPKLGFAQLLLLFTLTALLVRSFRLRFELPRLGPQGIALLAFLAICASSMAWAQSTSLALHALSYFATWVLLYYVCLVALSDIIAVWTLVTSGIAAASVTALWTLAEDATHGAIFGQILPRLPDWRGYLAAGLGNSGHIAGYLGLFCPALCVWFLAIGRFSWLAFLAIFLTIPALIVTWSVGSTSAFLIALCAFFPALFVRSVREQLHWKRLWAIVATSIAWKAFYFLPHPLNPHRPSLLLEAFASRRWAEGWPTRVAIWKTTLQMIRERPWHGWGVGNFTYAFVQQIVPSVVADPQLRVWAGAYTNEAHNEYLQVWAEGGFIALVAYLAIFVAFYLRAHRMFWSSQSLPLRLLTWSSAVGVTVFLLDSMMTFPLRLPSHIAALMLFLAIPQVGSASSSGHAVVPPSRRVLTAAFVSMGLVLALTISVFHARRLMAEFYLKQARTVAESPIVLPNGNMTSAWHGAETAFQKGTQLLSAGDLKGAQEALRAAQELAQSFALQLADPLFRKALEWDPRYSNASSRYGALLLMRGNYAEAASLLRQTLLDLESYEVHERLGYAFYFLGEKEAAAEEWTTCLLRRPSLAEHFRSLVRLTQP